MRRIGVALGLVAVLLVAVLLTASGSAVKRQMTFEGVLA